MEKGSDATTNEINFTYYIVYVDSIRLLISFSKPLLLDIIFMVAPIYYGHPYGCHISYIVIRTSKHVFKRLF